MGPKRGSESLYLRRKFIEFQISHMEKRTPKALMTEICGRSCKIQKMARWTKNSLVSEMAYFLCLAVEMSKDSYRSSMRR